jgi:hypothetical protein
MFKILGNSSAVGWKLLILIVVGGLVFEVVRRVRRDNRKEKTKADLFASFGWTYTNDGWGFTVTGCTDGVDWTFTYSDPDSGAVSGRWQTSTTVMPDTCLLVLGHQIANSMLKGLPGNVMKLLKRIGLKNKTHGISALITPSTVIDIGSEAFRKQFAVFALEKKLAEAAITHTVQEALTNWPESGAGPLEPEDFVWICLDEKGLCIDSGQYVKDSESVAHLVSIGVMITTALIKFRSNDLNSATS